MLIASSGADTLLRPYPARAAAGVHRRARKGRRFETLPSTSMKTTHVRAVDTQDRWLLYDASEHTLGRMAAKIAVQLMGKDRPEYTPSELTGAHVVVIQSAKVKVTGKGKKETSSTYAHFSGYTSGLKVVPLGKMRERRPNDVIKLAVRRMLPKTRLGHRMLMRLKVYSGTDHPHTAQQPVKVEAS